MNIKLIVFILLGNFGKSHGFLSVFNKILNGKVTKSCENDFDDSSSLMDGIIDSVSFVVIKDYCLAKSLFVDILLLENVIVTHVVIFPGECRDCNAWNYFIVKTCDSSNKKCSLCAEYSKIFQNFPMRVNCRLAFDLYDNVRIEGHTEIYSSDKMIQLSEVEIYVLRSNFYGCFKDISGQMLNVSDDQCFTSCLNDQRNIFMAFQQDHCYCLGNFPVDKIRCTKSSFNVYTVRVPWLHYVGCYSPPTEKSIIKVDLKNLSPERCIKFCAKRAMSYSYLQYKNCICDDNEPKINRRMKFDQCYFKCPGGGNYCGGKSAASLYSGCYEKGNNMSCIDVYQCENENFDTYGVCNTYCNKGWAGKYCMDMIGTENIRNKVKTYPHVSVPRKKKVDYNKNVQIFCLCHWLFIDFISILLSVRSRHFEIPRNWS